MTTHQQPATGPVETRRVGVLGAGSWGTALAKVAAENAREVILWSYEPDVADAINQTHENTRYLKGIRLPANLRATTSLEEACLGMDTILQVTPSHAVRSMMTEAAPFIAPMTPILSASKGIENGSLMLMSEVLEDALPEALHPYLVFLAGPSFAREVAEQQPSAVVVAARMHRVGSRARELITVPYIRTYITDDVPGVEIGGAIKNVIAIAAGAAEGMGLGFNTRAAIITRGLAELTRLAVHLGANPMTLSGLAGMGDMVLTCTGSLSRNRTVGFELGRGRPLDEVLAGMTQVAEGVKTAQSVHDLAARHGVDMPICEAVYQVLYGGQTPTDALMRILSRSHTAEVRLA
jgi:glycerol-3-phosphate dehydrogenase (NAD(P)+)